MMEKPYNQISENIKRIKFEIEETALKCGRSPNDIKLMAITKTRTIEEVNAAVLYGAELLGENKVQELCARYEGYDKKLPIHFVGHLQSNKVRQIIDKVEMIHSVDSFKIAQVIDRYSQAEKKITDILIQINIGDEESKFGVEYSVAEDLIFSLTELRNIRIRGLMTIPPIADDVSTEKYFMKMQQLFVDISAKKSDNITMDTISMGMSDDFKSAIKYGSNIVRIGTALFGERDYR